MSRIGTVMQFATMAAIAPGVRRPLRRVTRPTGPRIVRNLGKSAMCAAVVALTEAPVTQAIARANARQRRTFVSRVEQATIPIGVDDLEADADVALGRALVAPFV